MSGFCCGCWVIGGLLIGFLPTDRGQLRCTFLAVGHGNAVLLELPNGKTVLYDVGSLQNGSRATRIVRDVLFARRIAQLDAIVISHADVDHFNGAKELLDSVPVGTILFNRQFLDFQQTAVAELCDHAVGQNISMMLVAENDSLLLDDDVRITVLQSPRDENFGSDNANSLIVEIEYASQRILLTGDLEGNGLTRLLDKPARPISVLSSPHHGSGGSNTAELAKWAQPRLVVASGARRSVTEPLARTYGPNATLFSTTEDGAVTIVITSDGKLTATPFRKP